MSDDVKELLGKAFGEEPPLGIDRDEVLRKGRKRLRRRRFLEAGSVVALVVVVAVGASTLTNIAGSGQDEHHRLPPAASRSDHAPPGPDLPVPSTPVSTTFEVPPDPESAEQQLTAVLYTTGLIDLRRVAQVPGKTGQPQFTLKDNLYTYEADYNRTPTRRGHVRVEVDLTPTVLVPCDDLTSNTDECETRVVNGTSVTVNRYSDNNERSARATAVFADHVRVTAWATNLSYTDRELHRKPKSDTPILSEEELCLLVTKVGQRG